MSQMVVCDLSAIEFVVVGWLARCRNIMNVLEMRRDPYIDFATHLYREKGLDYDSLYARYKSDDVEAIEYRQNSKPPVLAAGFGVGGGDLYTNAHGDVVRGGLWGYALNVCMVDMPKELAHKAVEIYRQLNHEVPILWQDMERGFKWVLRNGGTAVIGEKTFDKNSGIWQPVENNFTGAKLTFSCEELPGVGPMVRLRLPSGRYLHYLNPSIEEEKFQYVDKKSGKKRTAIGEVIYYDGIEHSAVEEEGKITKKSHGWGRTKSYGAKLVENSVQAIARDILVNGFRLAREMGFPIFGVFHDEIATEVSDSFDAPSLADLRYCMTVPPIWGPTLPLAADGWTGLWYRKN